MADPHWSERVPRCDECGAIQHRSGSCFHYAWCSLSTVSPELTRLRAENKKLQDQLAKWQQECADLKWGNEKLQNQVAKARASAERMRTLLLEIHDEYPEHALMRDLIMKAVTS